MKIFFIIKNHFPHGLATTTRAINYCKGFIENGIECEVIIPIAFERYEEQTINKEYKGVYEGIPFQYISKTPKRSKHLFYRKIKDILDYVKTLIYVYKHVTEKDIVLVYEGGNVWFRFLAQTVHCRKSHIVMELNELPFGTGIETNKTKKKREYILKNIFPLYDGFITISENLSNLVLKYSPNSKILKVPIIVDSSISECVKSISINRPYLFHSGSLSEQKDGIIGMLEAFAIANKKLNYQLDYILTGYPEKSRDYHLITHIIDKYKLADYIHFVGYLANDDLRAYQKNCLAMIINKYDTQQNKYCFSTKLGEYLSFAKPIIITDIGEAMHYLNETNSFIVKAGSSQEIAEKIIHIVLNEQDAINKGKEGYKLAKEIFNYKYQSKRIIPFFKTIIES